MKMWFFFLCFIPLVVIGQGDSFTWQTFSVGSPAFTMEVPGKLIPQQVELPPDVKAYIKTYDAYYLKNEARGLVISMMHVAYDGEIIADLVGAANGTIAQWQATGSKVDIQAFTKQITAGKNSVVQKGLFFLDGKQSVFTNMVIGEGSSMWQIAVIVPSKDETMQLTMDRIINSIDFK